MEEGDPGVTDGRSLPIIHSRAMRSASTIPAKIVADPSPRLKMEPHAFHAMRVNPSFLAARDLINVSNESANNRTPSV
jgi:hypothetical protein